MADIVLQEGDNVLNVQLVKIVANLYGVVTDAATGLPINGVNVTINGLTTTTNANGEYAFEGLAPGSYVIEFSKAGYHTLTR